MEKGKKLSEADTDEYVAEKVAEVGGLAASDTNVDVAGLGALAVTASGTYNGSRTADGLAQIAATTATDLKNKKKTLGIDAHNAIVDKVNVVYKADTDHIKGLGIPLSKIATAKDKCPKIINGKGEQWIHDNFAKLSWKSLGDLADYYTVEECTGDVTIEANWYAADKATSKTAKDVIVKVKTRNVPIWWRVTGWNSAGE